MGHRLILLPSSCPNSLSQIDMPTNDQLMARIASLEQQMNLLKNASTIPREIDDAFRNRFNIPQIGTYLPTLTNVTNVASSTAQTAQFIKIGNMVLVSGYFTVDPTSTALTKLGISLPAGHSFSSSQKCAGVAATSDNITDNAAAIQGDTTNNRAQMVWSAASASARDMYFIFLYQ